MKITQKILSISMAMILGLTMLTGCGAKSDSTKKKVIGVLIADFSDQFQVHVKEQMEKEAAKHTDFEVLYQDGKYDAQKQIAEAENLIVKQVDSIILFQVDDDSAMVIAKKAKEAEIPLIAVNRPLPDPSYAISYVGSDSIESGEIEATQIVKELNEKGNIVILNGTLGSAPQRDRRKGYDNILKNYPDIKILGENNADWARDKGMKIMENWLQKDMKIDAVLSNNDEMAMGAINAIEAAGKTGDIIVAGIDGTPEAYEYIEKGQMTFTVFQNCFDQGAGSIDAAVKTANGETIKKEIIIPYQLVTKEKIAEFKALFE